MMYEVIVGNIGTVYSGSSQKKAEAKFKEYVSQSKAGYGRAAGEPVTLMINGEPSREYAGTMSEENPNPTPRRRKGASGADDNPHKAHQEIVLAFFQGRKKRIAPRYETDGTSLWVHGNLVAQKRPDGVAIDDADWRTLLTRSVLNEVLRQGEAHGLEPGRIYQKASQWYLSTRADDAEWPGQVVIPPAERVPR